MNFYKMYELKRRDIDVQCTINIPKAVIERLRLKKGDGLKLTVENRRKGRERIVLEPVKRRK